MNLIDEANIKYIVDHYGASVQREVLVEECAELIQAVQKLKRAELHDAEKLGKVTAAFVEELADVTIMVEQMKQTLTPALLNDYNKTITAKLDRQMTRILQEKSKQNNVKQYGYDDHTVSGLLEE